MPGRRKSPSLSMDRARSRPASRAKTLSRKNPAIDRDSEKRRRKRERVVAPGGVVENGGAEGDEDKV